MLESYVVKVWTRETSKEHPVVVMINIWVSFPDHMNN
jgi:hypothetical protein